MTTLQAVFGQFARHAGEARDKRRRRAAAHTALGIALIAALLVAALAIRVLVYVQL